MAYYNTPWGPRAGLAETDFVRMNTIIYKIKDLEK